MSIIGYPGLLSPADAQTPGLPSVVRDKLMRDDNGGVRFLFDLGFPWCYPGGAAATRGAAGDPANSAAIYDMTSPLAGVSPRGGNGLFRLSSGTVTYAGNGFDLSNAATNDVVVGPAAALADIWNAAPTGAAEEGASQHFLVFTYVRLPAQADWSANSNNSLQVLFGVATASNGYASTPELVMISMRGGSPYQLDARRQTALNVIGDNPRVTPNDYGAVAQVCYWRNASGTGFSVKTSGGRVTTTGSVGSANAVNFSAAVPYWGRGQAFTANLGGNEWRNVRVFRGGIENLARSGRDPITVMDADWDRVTTRSAGVFS